MTQVTIDDADLAALQRQALVGKFADQLWRDPKVNDDLKAIIKRANPDMEIPGYDTEQRILARLDGEKRERVAREEKDRLEAEEKQLSDRIDAAVSKYSLTDNGRETLMRVMSERQIGDPDAAAELFVARQPRTVKSSEGSDGMWHHNKADDFKSIFTDPLGWARKEFMSGLQTRE